MSRFLERQELTVVEFIESYHGGTVDSRPCAGGFFGGHTKIV